MASDMNVRATRIRNPNDYSLMKRNTEYSLDSHLKILLEVDLGIFRERADPLSNIYGEVSLTREKYGAFKKAYQKVCRLG